MIHGWKLLGIYPDYTNKQLDLGISKGNFFISILFLFILFFPSCGGNSISGFYAISIPEESGPVIYSINILNDSTLIIGKNGKEQVCHYRLENNYLFATDKDLKDEIIGKFVTKGIKVSEKLEGGNVGDNNGMGIFVKTTPEAAKKHADSVYLLYKAEGNRIMDSINEADKQSKIIQDQMQRTADSIAHQQELLMKKQYNSDYSGQSRPLIPE